MARRHRASAQTLALQARALENRAAARKALREGRTLRVSNRTDIEAGTVHQALAVTLVRWRYAEYPPDPAREGWLDMSQIRPGIKA